MSASEEKGSWGTLVAQADPLFPDCWKSRSMWSGKSPALQLPLSLSEKAKTCLKLQVRMCGSSPEHTLVSPLSKEELICTTKASLGISHSQPTFCRVALLGVTLCPRTGETEGHYYGSCWCRGTAGSSVWQPWGTQSWHKGNFWRIDQVLVFVMHFWHIPQILFCSLHR